MESVLEVLKRIGAGRAAVMALVGLGVLGLLIYMSLSLSAPTLTPLYSGLSPTDSTQIVSQLQSLGVEYETKDGGTQVLVPADQVLPLRVRLSGQGMPSGGSVIGYEIFDRSEGLGTSNFVYNVNYIRALEGELSRTVGAFNGIESARVHLVIPKRELFAQNKAFPTASVALTLMGGNRPKKEEIAAIRHLIATAVPGLQPSRITIVDNNGRLLARGGTDDDAFDDSAEVNDEYRLSVENRLKKSIEGLLEESLGVGRVRAEVTADLDMDKVVTTSEIYDPDGQVARSVQSTTENERSSEQNKDDTVSVENNLPDTNAGTAGSSNSSSTEKTDEVTNFEISKTVKNHIQEVGSIKKLSVAVLVDGTYSSNEDGTRTYVPLTTDEISQLDKLVKSAIGYDEKRGDKVEVVNMQFSMPSGIEETSSAIDWLKQDLPSVLQTAIFGIVAILAILMVVRPLVNRMLEAPSREEEEDLEALSGPAIAGQVSEEAARAAEAAMSAAEEEEVLIDVDRVKGKVKSSSIKRITGLVEEHPEETLSVLRQWMNG